MHSQSFQRRVLILCLKSRLISVPDSDGMVQKVVLKGNMGNTDGQTDGRVHPVSSEYYSSRVQIPHSSDSVRHEWMRRLQVIEIVKLQLFWFCEQYTGHCSNPFFQPSLCFSLVWCLRLHCSDSASASFGRLQGRVSWWVSHIWIQGILKAICSQDRRHSIGHAFVSIIIVQCSFVFSWIHIFIINMHERDRVILRFYYFDQVFWTFATLIVTDSFVPMLDARKTWYWGRRWTHDYPYRARGVPSF